MVAHRTPEHAALAGFPVGQARVLAIAQSPTGDHAVVLLGTNEEPVLYPYEVDCERDDSGWVERGGGNGPGWRALAPDQGDAAGNANLGVTTDWAEAPAQARAAVVRYRGDDHQVPVSHGYFLFAAWDVPAAESNERPEVVGFLPRGR
jgi:hypothetical protein